VVLIAGWLLVVPPFSGDATLPVSEWDVKATYGSARECERARDQLLKERSDAVNEYDFHLWDMPTPVLAAAQQAEDARCVPDGSSKAGDGSTKRD
jgi:hypothetical protein